jgi:hypothetical protein
MSRSPEEKLLNPRPGSEIAAAKEFGIDLTLVVAQLRLSPQERLDSLQANMEFVAELDAARRLRKLDQNGKPKSSDHVLDRTRS